jgi:flagellar basal-body rod protein FlgC
MDYSRMFAISAAGMEAERTRVEAATINLANANTVARSDGQVFQPQRVVLHTVPLAADAFGSAIDRALEQRGGVVTLVPQASVEDSGLPARKRYEPGNPLADAAGFVAKPDVDSATEMLTIMAAMRAYEANVAAATTARNMALKALDLGGGA